MFRLNFNTWCWILLIYLFAHSESTDLFLKEATPKQVITKIAVKLALCFMPAPPREKMRIGVQKCGPKLIRAPCENSFIGFFHLQKTA
jgi:hypothetical protein